MTDKIDGRKNNRPPTNHQFKQGQSGNPRGRPKKRPREFSENQLLRDVLHISAMKVKVNRGRGKKEYTLQEATILQDVHKGREWRQRNDQGRHSAAYRRHTVKTRPTTAPPSRA